jgi:hypothetical protein
MSLGVLALVGTRKGLFVLRGDDDRRGWRVDGPLLDGSGVYHATVDARDGAFYAATNHLVDGPTVQRSADRARRGTARGAPGRWWPAPGRWLRDCRDRPGYSLADQGKDQGLPGFEAPGRRAVIRR